MSRPSRATTEPGQGGLHDLVQGHARLEVQLGGEPDLGVHDAIGGEVLDALGRHPLERLGGLHDAPRCG